MLVLQWHDFQANVNIAFYQLRGDIDFADVTIVCGDNLQVEAHKIILATSSSFFHKMLRQTKHTHPFLYLRCVKGNSLVSILDIIYHGEVNVLNKDLEEFMMVGEELQIKGLERTQENLKGEVGNAIINT